MTEIDLIHGDALELLKNIESSSIDMILTSPPYDDTKNYNNSLSWNFETFKNISFQINRVIKQGGTVVWVIGDKTKNGSESGTSFKQALYFNELGLNIHDTMIFKKLNYTPLTHNRYEQEFEYIFVFSKGKPKTFNPIKIPCKWAGTETWGKPSFYKTDSDNLTSIKKKTINDTKIKGNIFEYRVGSTKTGKFKHPAMFPYELARDMIFSWSNENDLILDCFMGSGTTGLVCKENNRRFIGIEIVLDYYKIAWERING